MTNKEKDELKEKAEEKAERTEKAAAKAAADEKPKNPEPDVEHMNAHAQTAQEQMMEAAPGTLPDVEKQRAEEEEK